MFIDLEKAYDRIIRKQLWATLVEDLGIDRKLVDLLKLLYTQLSVKLAEDIEGVWQLIQVAIGLK